LAHTFGLEIAKDKRKWINMNKKSDKGSNAEGKENGGIQRQLVSQSALIN